MDKKKPIKEKNSIKNELCVRGSNITIILGAA